MPVCSVQPGSASPRRCCQSASWAPARSITKHSKASAASCASAVSCASAASCASADRSGSKLFAVWVTRYGRSRLSPASAGST